MLQLERRQDRVEFIGRSGRAGDSIVIYLEYITLHGINKK